MYKTKAAPQLCAPLLSTDIASMSQQRLHSGSPPKTLLQLAAAAARSASVSLLRLGGKSGALLPTNGTFDRGLRSSGRLCCAASDLCELLLLRLSDWGCWLPEASAAICAMGLPRALAMRIALAGVQLTMGACCECEPSEAGISTICAAARAPNAGPTALLARCFAWLRGERAVRSPVASESPELRDLLLADLRSWCEAFSGAAARECSGLGRLLATEVLAGRGVRGTRIALLSGIGSANASLEELPYLMYFRDSDSRA